MKSEIRAGRKRTHWMWYIFPQIHGLGYSSISRYYAVRNLQEAKDYLKDPVLGKRLNEISEALLSLQTDDPCEVFGSPDDMKLLSSMTLFEQADLESRGFVYIMITVLSAAANMSIIVFEIIGLWKREGGFEWKMFRYYTQLSNAAALAASVLFLVTRGSTASVYLRYLASTMLIMTAFVTICILVPMGGGFRKMLLSSNGLYHHTLNPILSVVSYIFWEPHASSACAWLLPAGVTLVYGVMMMVLNGLRKVDGPYPFFQVHNQSRIATVIWTIVLFGAISVFAILLNLAAEYAQ